MMSGITVVAWLCLGLFIRLTAGENATTSTTSLSTGEQILEKLDRMEQEQDSWRQTWQSLFSVTEYGSRLEPSAVKNKRLTLEARLEATAAKLEAIQAKHEATETKLKLEATETKLEAMETKLEATNTALQAIRVQSKGASTFTRWGRTTCSNNSQLVYSGVAGGSHYTHTGAAANLLCLTLSPQNDSTSLPTYYAFLYGTEYEQSPLSFQDENVPCSVCLAAQSATIMIPATHHCPTGWTTQYTGLLAAGYHSHNAASEYVCLDGDLEATTDGYPNQNGKLLYYVVTQCGSLPCPPYSNGKIVRCVVCSK